MTDDAPPQPHLTEKAAAARAERLAREAAALRANMKRRKAQARARDLPPLHHGDDEPAPP